MKNTKQCPKCGSTRILRIDKQNTYSNNQIYYNLAINIPVTRYVFSNCGFSEDWVEKQEYIDKLTNKYG